MKNYDKQFGHLVFLFNNNKKLKVAAISILTCHLYVRHPD